MNVKKIIESMNTVVDVTEEQQEMMIKLVEMKDLRNKDFEMKRITEDTQWELLRRV